MLATFTVTNDDDAIVNAPAAVGTLRQAIEDANNLAGSDAINFAPGLSGDINLTQGQISITDDVTIIGQTDASGNNKITIDGGGGYVLANGNMTAFALAG